MPDHSNGDDLSYQRDKKNTNLMGKNCEISRIKNLQESMIVFNASKNLHHSSKYVSTTSKHWLLRNRFKTLKQLAW